MTGYEPNNVEQLLVNPGKECACCIGRLGFEQGLKALHDARPLRTRKEILRLNPLFIRQLPSFRHQEAHVESMMSVMGTELPKLFKKWRKHLQTYPEMPYLLHFLIATSDGRAFHSSPEQLEHCKKASPFKFEPVDRPDPPGFALKSRWAAPIVVQEMLQSLTNILYQPVAHSPDQRAWLPQTLLMLTDQLKSLRQTRNTLEHLQSNGVHDSPEERQERLARIRRRKTLLEGAHRVLSETTIPAALRAIAADSYCDQVESLRTVFDRFIAAGGSFEESDFDIADFLLKAAPELLIHLDHHRDYLNGASVSVLEDNLEEIHSTLEERRQEQAARLEHTRTERLRREEVETARELEHRKLGTERRVVAFPPQDRPRNNA